MSAAVAASKPAACRGVSSEKDLLPINPTSLIKSRARLRVQDMLFDPQLHNKLLANSKPMPPSHTFLLRPHRLSILPPRLFEILRLAARAVHAIQTHAVDAGGVETAPV